MEAGAGLHSTGSEEVVPVVSQLEGGSEAIGFVDGCELGKPTVHLADREWDSLGPYRQGQHEKGVFIGRAKTQRLVTHAGREQS